MFRVITIIIILLLFSFLSLLVIKFYNPLQDRSNDDGTVNKADFVNLLIKQSQLYKDLVNTNSMQWKKHARNDQNWEERINPDIPIGSYLEEMWQWHSIGSSILLQEVELWLGIGGTTTHKDDFYKSIFIKSTQYIFFNYIQKFDPILAGFLRLAWKIMLHENISNCYDNEECRIDLVKFTIKEVCTVLVEIALQPGKLGLNTTTLSLQGVAYTVEVFADLAQAVLEYYDHDDLSKVLGAVENIFLKAKTGFDLWGPIGAAVGGAVGGICPAVEEAAERFLRTDQTS